MRASHPHDDFRFDRDQEEARALLAHLNPLPRSVIRRNAFLLLDGEWRFALDLEDCGLQEKWYLGYTYTETAEWPGTVEAHLAEAQEFQLHHPPGHDQLVAWYERDVEIPGDWLADPTAEVQVTFGACGYETRVWLNGHPLHTVEGEPVHFGEYTSFSYELPRSLLRTVNRLTVRVADSLDAEIPRGKQESRVYKRGGIWYQTHSGAVRSIWLEPIERNRLRSRLGVVSSVEDRLATFHLTTRVHDPGRYTLRLVVAARGSLVPLRLDEFVLPLESGQQRQQIAVELSGASLWSPESPTLYTLVAQLRGPTGHLSQIETHFGLRKIEARGRAIYLNSAPLYLDGILYQPGTATLEQMQQHFLAMKQLGCNLVRIHIAGIDPRLYDLADALGMLLWVEVPSPHSSSEASRANHRAELLRLLVIVASHPSVVIVSLYNEDWGAQDIATNAATRHYITECYNYMRLHYPQFLVVDNDGWNHVSSEGALASDLLTAHLYTPELARWRELLARFTHGIVEGVAAEPLVVGDPFFYRGQLPLVVSEWGGFGFPAYGGPDELHARAARIQAFKAALRGLPIAGDIYTQATSIEDEDNGLLDPQSGELLVPPGLLRSADERGER